MKKIIVISIICLFIGVGVQPALAIEPKVSYNNIENEEDCDCQTAVSEVDLNRIEKSIDSIEGYTKILSLYSKQYPEYEGISEELNRRISGLKERIQLIVNYNPMLIFCINSFIIFIATWPLANLLISIMDANPDTLLYDIFYPIAFFTALIALIFWEWAEEVGCLWAKFFNPFPENSLNIPFNNFIDITDF
jgi:hypothetical protein